MKNQIKIQFDFLCRPQEKDELAKNQEKKEEEKDEENINCSCCY